MRRWLLLFTILAAGCGRLPDGPSRTGQSRERVLVPVDSIGVELGAAEYMLGVFDPCTAADRSILVLDRTVLAVRKYSPEGTHECSIDIGGSGPGQFNIPVDIEPLPGGGFAVAGAADRKTAVFGMEMEHIQDLLSTSTGGMGPMEVCALTDSLLLCRYYQFREDSVTGSLVLTGPSGDHGAVSAEKTVQVVDGSNWHDQASFMYAAADDGTFYLSEYSTDSWRIEHRDAHGEVLDVLERKYLPIPFTPEETAHAEDVFSRRYVHAYNTSAGMEFSLPEYRNAIESVSVDHLGHIWVEEGTEATADFRVYSPSGEFLFTCSLVMPRWQICDGWQVVIDRNGYLAYPINPEYYPLLYVLELRD